MFWFWSEGWQAGVLGGPVLQGVCRESAGSLLGRPSGFQGRSFCSFQTFRLLGGATHPQQGGDQSPLYQVPGLDVDFIPKHCK